MTSVNFSSIEQKAKAYINSDEGKKRCRDKLDEYVRNNRSKTAAGSNVMTVQRMIQITHALVSTIKATAASCDLPDSVMQDINSLACGAPQKQSNGSYTVEVVFANSLTRPSLEPSKYGGVHNIISIFNNGYSKMSIQYVAGYWHGEYIKALPERTGAHFMQDAVRAFNTKYGAQYDITVELSNAYN